jgi:hypothetical protein
VNNEITKNTFFLSVREVNEALLATRVPSEFSRRPRELDFPNLKAEEYRNLLIFYFPAILHRLAPIPGRANSGPSGHGAKNERGFFAKFVYLLRALLLPADEYTFQPEQIEDQQERLYRSYEVYPWICLASKITYTNFLLNLSVRNYLGKRGAHTTLMHSLDMPISCGRKGRSPM